MKLSNECIGQVFRAAVELNAKHAERNYAKNYDKLYAVGAQEDKLEKSFQKLIQSFGFTIDELEYFVVAFQHIGAHHTNAAFRVLRDEYAKLGG